MKDKPDVMMLPPGPLQVERLPDGKRRLLRALNLQILADKVHIPVGFVTDFSSWPRLFPGPRFQKVDIAGVVHDWCFQHATLGWKGRPIGYAEANRIWYIVARSGSDPGARASWFWGNVGWLGLTVGSWPVWIRLRRRDS